MKVQAHSITLRTQSFQALIGVSIGCVMADCKAVNLPMAAASFWQSCRPQAHKHPRPNRDHYRTKRALGDIGVVLVVQRK